jgi:antitoxin component of MazEF toxin-antitoxin module
MAKIYWEIMNITKIGNSYGIILNRKIMNHLQLKESRKISVTFKDRSIELKNAEKAIPVNLDLSTWGKQFDKAFKLTGKPEKSVWPNEMSGEADNEWVW